MSCRDLIFKIFLEERSAAGSLPNNMSAKSVADTALLA